MVLTEQIRNARGSRLGKPHYFIVQENIGVLKCKKISKDVISQSQKWCKVKKNVRNGVESERMKWCRVRESEMV